MDFRMFRQLILSHVEKLIVLMNMNVCNLKYGMFIDKIRLKL
jgi:hypothetical protein